MTTSRTSGCRKTAAAAASGAAHLLAFTGTDCLPALGWIDRNYPGSPEGTIIGGSVPATEHSVMCAGTQDDEIETFVRLLDLYPTGIVSIVSDTWDLWHVCTGILPTLIVFLIGQSLESNFITPKLVGERIGLHPVAVIFALMAFGQLFGLIGVLLALPMAAVLYVGLRHLVVEYRRSRFYRDLPRRRPQRRARDDVDIGIARKEIYSNQIAFDGKKRNYSNKFVIDYKVTHRFIPYFEVADVYVDKDTDERQARYRVGFKYKF